jgi:hypothetical protein
MFAMKELKELISIFATMPPVPLAILITGLTFLSTLGLLAAVVLR